MTHLRTVLAATDPAQPYGASLPWPVKGPQRAAGALVVLHRAEPAVYVERGGKGLQLLADDPAPALRALADFVLNDRKRKLSIERVNGEPVVGSDHEALLIELGVAVQHPDLCRNAAGKQEQCRQHEAV